MEIDWIMGNPRVGFTEYTADRSVQGHASDHPLVAAAVHINQ
jgi:hypothetical protein